MFQKMLQGGEGGIPTFDVNPTGVSGIVITPKETEVKPVLLVHLEGTFVVTKATPTNVFFSNLPKPKQNYNNAGTITTTISQGSVTINTNGEALTPDYSYFSANYTWNYNITYSIDIE